MTGGNVVVLGNVGRNTAAGMTGGVAYILDEFEANGEDFLDHVNLEIVKAQRVVTPEGKAMLRSLVEQHAEHTGSAKAKEILGKWDEHLPRFWQLVPPGESLFWPARPGESFKNEGWFPLQFLC
ncbi:unnamed protein product [Discosporangium mesarthrocarpum]